MKEIVIISRANYDKLLLQYHEIDAAFSRKQLTTEQADTLILAAYTLSELIPRSTHDHRAHKIWDKFDDLLLELGFSRDELDKHDGE